jgi:putative transposase
MEGKERAALAAEGMAVPKRHARVPGTYFVTSRTWQSRPLFRNEPCCRILIESLLHYRSQGVYALYAFVLMPDHFHILLQPSCETTLERAVQYIKGGSAHRIGKEMQYNWPIWQRGFSDHRIRDWADFERHCRYLEENPVRKKLAAVPQEFEWSSASGKYPMNGCPQGLKPQEDEVIAAARRHG